MNKYREWLGSMMKRHMVLVLTLVLALLLAACGVPQQKLDEAQAKYDELMGLYDQAEASMRDLAAIADEMASMGGEVDDTTGEELSAFKEKLDDMRAEQAEVMGNLQKLREAEVDGLIEVLDSEIADSHIVLELLDEGIVELGALRDSMAVFMEQVARAEEIFSQLTYAPEGLEEAIGEMEEILNEFNDDLFGLDIRADFDAETFRALLDTLRTLQGSMQKLTVQMDVILSLVQVDSAA